jgi:multidrug efflux system outer membrane protein
MAGKSYFHCAMAILAMAALGGCKVGPNYQRPDVSALVPGDWHWKMASPADQLEKGPWWEAFHDPALNELENRALTNNFTLQSAVARLDQARAVARVSRSRYLPALSANPGLRHERTSGNLPTPIPFDVPSALITSYSVPFDLSYEIDVWGRVRRSFEAAKAEAQAGAADLETVRLSACAETAVSYFFLRSLDEEIETLQKAIRLREDSIRVLTGRFQAGAALEIDLERAKAELANSRIELAESGRMRAELFNALALLCGTAPASFNLPPHAPVSKPFAPPANLPADLLERRPDIASAERRLASSNARIGVARAAYYPAIRLTGQAGYLSADAQDLFAGDSRIWSIGPGVSIPLFTGGRTTAQVRQAEAAYAENLADYRQAVLSAFKDVEDSLAAVDMRREQIAAQEQGLRSAARARDLAQARHDAGVGSYLELIDAERVLLAHQRRLAQLHGQQFAAQVRLIKALGGGWAAEGATAADVGPR